MLRFALCAVVSVLIQLVPDAVSAQNKEYEQIHKKLTELQAQVEQLKTKVAKLEGDAGQPLPALAEHDKKWVRNLAADFMREMLRKRDKTECYDSRRKKVSQFVSNDLPNFVLVEDPNLKVRHEMVLETSSGLRKSHVYSGLRRCYLDYVFDKYQVDAEDIGPGKTEVLIQGKLTGDKTEFVEDKYYYGHNGFRARGSSQIIDQGKLGPRSGTFTLRLSRDKDTKRWVISYFAWTIDELKKEPEKK